MKRLGPNIFKIMIILVVAVILLGLISGCQNVFFIPGASYGYYLWEDEKGVHVFWSVDRKDTSFSGTIAIDGELTDYELVDWEDTDNADIDGSIISFTANLSREDYSDGIILRVTDYKQLELDLMINGTYDRSRVHAGAFLNNPSTSPFIIEKGYFDDIRSIPWYEKHPFSGFFYKLFANKYFTFIYLFIIGVVIIEIIRITAISVRKRKGLYTGISYIALIAILILIYFILRFFVI
ncbi:hypothetical protein ACFLQS_02455 [Actinomycetota bacterium]